MDSREKKRYVAACKRAYFRYCRGDDAGVLRISAQVDVPLDHVVDVALDNSCEESKLRRNL